MESLVIDRSRITDIHKHGYPALSGTLALAYKVGLKQLGEFALSERDYPLIPLPMAKDKLSP